jgi:hypothetical protein
MGCVQTVNENPCSAISVFVVRVSMRVFASDSPGISPVVLAGVPSCIVAVVYASVLAGVSPGVLAGVSPGVLAGVSSDVTPLPLNGLLFGIS